MRERRERGRKLPQVKPKKIRWRKDKGKRDRENRKGKKKKTKRKSKEGKEKKKGRVCDMGGKERKKKERHFPSKSPANRRSKRVGVRDKVGLRDESYA